MEREIVIGVDGSAHAAAALRWGVQEARLRGVGARAVLVTADPAALAVRDGDDPGSSEAAQWLERWAEEALGAEHDVALQVAYGDPARELVEAGDAGDLLVLGARGSGGFEALLVGSVSEEVVTDADGPVVVVRDAAPVDGGRVVVGVDGSRLGHRALLWAATEARTRGAVLDVVHAWQVPLAAASPWVVTPPDFDDEAREVLDQAMAEPLLEGLHVTTHLHRGTATEALLERATGAGLVVVGSRGLGRVRGFLVGSVTRQLLHHAPCPLAVV